jgi:hypothetical protein
MCDVFLLSRMDIDYERNNKVKNTNSNMVKKFKSNFKGGI